MTDEILKKFTNAARKIMALANQATQELNHEYIGPEHMLIGLSRMEFGAGAMALTKMEITPLLVGHTLQKRLTPGQPRVITGKINRTPRADRVIEAARQEAEDSRSPTINSGHLLLGLLHHSEDVSSQVLTELGATLEKALNVLRDLPQSVFEDEDKPNKPTESDILAGVFPMFHAVSALRARSPKLISLIGFNEHFSTLLISCLIDSTTDSGQIDDRQLVEKLSAALARPELT